jgi:histidine triad (HIT) family protein
MLRLARIAAKLCFMSSSPEPSRDHCLFCQIGAGRTEAHEIFRNDRIVAFLDTSPIRDGHVQIIPLEHFATFEALPPDVCSEIMLLGQRIAATQKTLYSVERVAFMFTGGDVPHAHAHVFPLVEKTDVTSRRYIATRDLKWKSPPKPEEAALRKTALALSNGLAPVLKNGR